MGGLSKKQGVNSQADSSLRKGIRLRPKPSFMRLKIRRLLKSFLPVSQLRKTGQNLSNN